MKQQQQQQATPAPRPIGVILSPLEWVTNLPVWAMSDTGGGGAAEGTGETEKTVETEEEKPAETGTGEAEKTGEGEEAGTGAAAGAAAETKAETPPPDWRDKRIAQLTARLRESERRAANVETATGEAPPLASGIPADAAELDRLVDARASEKAALDEFNRRCVEVVTAGQGAFPDFSEKVNDLKSLVDWGNASEALNYNQFLLAALETGEAPALLHRLGSNLNEAMRVLGLSPVRMAVELTKMAAAPPAGETSGAPRPMRPPIGSAAGSREPIDPTDAERSDRLTTAEWMRRRNAQVDGRTIRRA